MGRNVPGNNSMGLGHGTAVTVGVVGKIDIFPWSSSGSDCFSQSLRPWMSKTSMVQPVVVLVCSQNRSCPHKKCRETIFFGGMGNFCPISEQNFVFQPMKVCSTFAQSRIGDNVGQKTWGIEDVVKENLSEAPITFPQGNFNLAYSQTDYLAFSSSDGCCLMP
jgi:hypothetical protein